MDLIFFDFSSNDELVGVRANTYIYPKIKNLVTASKSMKLIFMYPQYANSSASMLSGN